jgi:hypothetical protein
MADWKEEHPDALNDIDPVFLKSLVDNSWCNDDTPQFTKPIDDKYCLLITMDYEDISLREVEDSKRFHLHRCVREGDYCEMSNDDPLLYKGDDFELLKQAIADNSV